MALRYMASIESGTINDLNKRILFVYSLLREERALRKQNLDN